MEYKYYDNVRVPKYAIGRQKYKGLVTAAHLISESIPIFHKLVDFNDDIVITLKPMRGDTKGYYDPNVDEIEADFRYCGDFGVLSIVAHELVHAEQYKQGRLDSEWCGTAGGYMYTWNNALMFVIEKDYNKYIPPWEVEAYQRQDELALIVCSELGV